MMQTVVFQETTPGPDSGFFIDPGAIVGRYGRGAVLPDLQGVDLFSDVALGVCGWLSAEREAAVAGLRDELFDGPVELAVVAPAVLVETTLARVDLFDGPVQPVLFGATDEATGDVSLGLIAAVVVAAVLVGGLVAGVMEWSRRLRARQEELRWSQ